MYVRLYELFMHLSKDEKLCLVILTAKFVLFTAELLEFLTAPEPTFHLLSLLETKTFSDFFSSLFVSLFIAFFANCTSAWTSSLFGL